MSVSKKQPSTFKTINVRHGLHSQLFFICLVDLQPGTDYLDIWTHLQRPPIVRRLEHVEVFPDSQTAWVCIRRKPNFWDGLDALMDPIYVKSTRTATIVTISATNIDQPIRIRYPDTQSNYVQKIMGTARQYVTYFKKVAKADKSTEADKPVVASKTIDPARDIIIAHGSYVPGAPAPGTNSHTSSGPNSGSHGTTHTIHLASGSPYTVSTTTSPGLAGSLPLPESHMVFLSGFSNNTTILQIRTMVMKALRGHELTDYDFRFVDRSTILTSNEADARKLASALNGFMFHGVQFTASYGQRPYELVTYPHPYPYPSYIYPSYLYPYPYPYPQTSLYPGFQVWGQNWQQYPYQY
ncbi:hypothetical protein EV127DRAFT_490263 [Xylaria flabelliformis]|nr:hypothetical protein EV127DRAFT_490263 [Xylaria flabelliformis]